MRGEITYQYQKLSSEDQKAFRRFWWANAVVGAILLTGLIALASKYAGGESALTAQHATVDTPTKPPIERTSLAPSR